MTPIFTGRVKYGKFVLDNPNKYLVWLSKLEGQYIELVVRKQKSQRSLNQNNYMWGVVYEILSQHLGYTTDEIHEICKFKFLRIIKVRGDEIGGMEYVRSTTKLNTSEFEEYLEKIKRWSAEELNCFIPDPNEVA